MTTENNNPVIKQDLGIVSKQLAPIVSIQQLQNILNTIGQNLENGSVDNPMVSFEGDKTTGFYYDANEGLIYGVSHGVKIFSFNQDGFFIFQPFINTTEELQVTGTNATNANIITAGITTLTSNSSGQAVILGDNLQNGSLLYIRNLTGTPVSLYPGANSVFYGLNPNQPITLLNTQFISIICNTNTQTNQKTYFASLYAGIDANGDAIFQHLVSKISTTTDGNLTIGDGGSLILEKANLKNEEGYIGVSSVGNMSVNASNRTTPSYQFNIITQADNNGLVQLPDMSEVLDGATIILKNITDNNVLVYPPLGQEIAKMGLNTPLYLPGNCGGMFTYVNGYWAHSILLETKPDGNIILPGSNAYSTYTTQAAVISYGSNQTNATGTVNITDQIVYLDNQYTNVSVENGTGSAVTSSQDGEENVFYTQNALMLPETIPVGAFIIIAPNYKWFQENNNNTPFQLQCDSNSGFITLTGVSTPATLVDSVTLSPNFAYLCIKTLNQWNTPIWIVCQLGIYTQDESYIFGNIEQNNGSIVFNTEVQGYNSISAASFYTQGTMTANALQLNIVDVTVNLGNTQEGGMTITDSQGFIFKITSVLAGSNGVTISPNESGANNICTFIIINSTSDEVLLFPSSGGTINNQPVNQSYTLGALESVLVSGTTDVNDNLHLDIVGLGLSDTVRSTSKFITGLPNNTGVLVSGNLEVQNGNITSPNVLTNENVQISGFLVKSYDYNIEATGTNQATATTLNAMVNIITQASDSYCVKPQTNLTPGTTMEIYNRSSEIIKIYPADGEQIELFNQNDFVLLPTNSTVKMTVIEENGRRMWVTTMLGGAITQT